MIPRRKWIWLGVVVVLTCFSLRTIYQEEQVRFPILFDVIVRSSSTPKRTTTTPPASLANNFTRFTCHVNNNNNNTNCSSTNATPFAFIPGAMKGGTSALMHFLSQHPNISPRNHGETHILDGRRYLPLYQNTSTHVDVCPIWEAYRRNFQRKTTNANTTGLLLLDKSPTYLLLSHIVPQRLLCTFPDTHLKIIIVLREPVDRAFSNWGHERNMRKAKKNFSSIEEWTRKERRLLDEYGLASSLTPVEEYQRWSAYMNQLGMRNRTRVRKSRDTTGLREKRNGNPIWKNHPKDRYKWKPLPHPTLHLLAKSMYSIQLRQWLAVIDDYYDHKNILDHILILDSNAFRQSPQVTLDRVTDFLELERHSVLTTPRHRTSYKGAVLSNATRAELEDFFRPWNAKLHELISPFGFEMDWAKRDWERMQRQKGIK